MLTAEEKKWLDGVQIEEIEGYLKNIISFNRLSGSTGEFKAVEYIKEELEKEVIECCVHRYPAYLSNPVCAELKCKWDNRIHNIPCKTRSFSGSTDGKAVEGDLVYIPQEKITHNFLEWQIRKRGYEKDLAGKVVISETANPVAVLELQCRGAVGYIQYWNGNEFLIHEGIFDLVWGMPLPNELDYYPSIPVIAINGIDGRQLIEKTQTDMLMVSMMTQLENKMELIPILEASIKPDSDDSKYLLIGNHLDSWYYGATDNGTGNALALYMAKQLNKIRNELPSGVKILWWSGHSNGRYAGSSIYGCEHFTELLSSCLAYMNIDMPGLKGAYDYSKITAGYELFQLARKCVLDVTGQNGSYSGPVRGWDQSFQNIGIPPYFIWASTLPEGHPYTTNNSFMSWWWHTEEDKLEYYESDVLLKDAKLYMLGARRLLMNLEEAFEIEALFKGILDELINLDKSMNGEFSFGESIEAIEGISKLYDEKKNRQSLSLDDKLLICKKLNQLYYAQRECYFQDRALEQKALPGYSLFRSYARWSVNESDIEILRHQLKCQQNRFLSICYDLKKFLSA